MHPLGSRRSARTPSRRAALAGAAAAVAVALAACQPPAAGPAPGAGPGPGAPTTTTGASATPTGAPPPPSGSVGAPGAGATPAAGPPPVGPTQTVAYTGSDVDLVNPGRGFFAALDPPYADPPQNRPPLEVGALAALRDEGVTMARVVYNLGEWRSAPLPAAFLQRVGGDLDAAREAGVQLIPRFSYGWLGQHPDAPADRILGHLDQLGPVLADRGDALAHVEAGFIGAWGQWNRSTNDLVDNTTLATLPVTRTIYDRILATVPASVDVVLPYVRNLTEFFGTTPLTAEEAHSGTGRARTGTHNDCFLAGPDDWGFYTDDRAAEEKAFLAEHNRYAVHGGEACASGGDAAQYTGCENAVRDLSSMHWSALNRDAPDGLGVLQRWRDEGCFDEISDRLGYRFRLTGATLPTTAAPGGALPVTLDVANDGYATPHKPTAAFLVLRHTGTGAEHRVPLDTDPRRWASGATTTVAVTATAPADLPAGEYALLLGLAEDSPRLVDRPEFRIRLANDGVVEPGSGLNSLGATLRVG